MASYAHPPEACLVNFYDFSARMGLHQDRDEADLAAPVVSISLGDSCCFRYRGSRRGDPAKKLELCSGDIVVMGGAARLMFHGVDKIHAGSSGLLPGGGRINLTLRRVRAPDRLAPDPGRKARECTGLLHPLEAEPEANPPWGLGIIRGVCFRPVAMCWRHMTASDHAALIKSLQAGTIHTWDTTPFLAI